MICINILRKWQSITVASGCGVVVRTEKSGSNEIVCFFNSLIRSTQRTSVTQYANTVFPAKTSIEFIRIITCLLAAVPTARHNTRFNYRVLQRALTTSDRVIR